VILDEAKVNLVLGTFGWASICSMSPMTLCM